MGVAAMVGQQGFDRPGLQRLAFQFLQLVAQPFAPLGRVAGARQRVALLLQRGPRARGGGHRGQLRGVPAIGVQQRQLAAT